MKSRLNQILRFIIIVQLSSNYLHSFAQVQSESAALRAKMMSTENDSIKGEIYYQLANKIKFDDIVQARVYADSGLYYFQKAGKEEKVKEKLYVDAVLYYTAGDLPSCDSMAQSYYDWTVEVKNDIRKSYALTLLAKVSRESGDLSRAIELSIQGLNVSEKNQEIDGQGYYVTELGNLYTELQQFDQAKEYFEKAYEISRQINFPIAEAVSLRNLAENALETNNTAIAIEYLQKAIIIDSTNSYNIGLSRSLRNMGHAYENQGAQEKAKEYYLQSYALVKGTDNKVDLCDLHQALAKIYLEENQLNLADYHTQSAGALVEKIKSLKSRAEQALLESISAEKKGDIKGALKWNKEYNSIYKNLINDKISHQITGLNIKYESDKKAREIELLNTQNELSEIRLEASNRRNIGLGIGLSLLGVLSFLLFNQSKKIKNQNHLIQIALNEKDTLLREIHHRVKNNLQFISSLLNLQSKHIEDKKALSALQEGQNRVKSMALIHQNLYQEDNLTGVEVKAYFEKLTSSIFDSYNISKEHVGLTMDIDAINLDVDTVIPIGLIVNELVSNSLKHAFTHQEKGLISVRLKESNNKLIIEISDNGKGIDMNNKEILNSSFGYKLIKAFESQLDAELVISGDSGTKVTMHITDYKKY